MASIAMIVRAVEVLWPDPEERAKKSFSAEHDELFIPGPHPRDLPEGTVEPGGPDADEDEPGDGWVLSAAPDVWWSDEYEDWRCFV